MSADNHVLPDALLAEGFARHIVNWSEQQAAGTSVDTAMLHAMAVALSLANSAGHVCAQLGDIAACNPAWQVSHLRACLHASGVTGTPSQRAAFPLILDDDDRLYLHRYFDYEWRLAQRLMQARAPLPTAAPAVQERLNSLFAANDATLAGKPNWQKIGAALSLLSPLTILSGGPGTGKTTTVVNLLACLLEQDPDCRIALAAPTGKAAARMLEALRARASDLPEELQARLPSTSFTIHRLLGVTADAGHFRHHAGHQLALDLLIVDEASMLDLALATKLFDAMPSSARIILLGDKDQLAAVESGAVFAELSADPTLDATYVAALADLTNTPIERIQPATPHTPTPLHNSVVWFTENFRFSKTSGIGRLAADINAGHAAAALALLETGNDASLRWLAIDGAQPGPDAMRAIFTGYAAYFEAIAECVGPPDGIFDVFNRFRVLCAVHDTPRGTQALNEVIGAHVRTRHAHGRAPGNPPAWYAGRPVMILRNDYVLGLFNGDIGLTFPDATGAMMVYFQDATDGLRAIAPVQLPDHDTAFAMTVHKSQGSEFAQVLLLLPAEANRVLSRELIYTAVTRARDGVVMVGSSEILSEAIETVTLRHSGLLARLAEASSHRK